MKRIGFVLLAAFIFSSCGGYTDQATTRVLYSHGTWDKDGTKFIFARDLQQYKHAKGITAFPDGGIPKYIRRELKIYLYDLPSDSVREITNVNGIERNEPDVHFSWGSGFFI